MFEDQSEFPEEVKTKIVSILFQLTTLKAMNISSSHISETFSRERTESDVCASCLDLVNALQAEIDFLRTLLREKKISIPYGPQQYGQSDLLLEAYKFIDALNSKIAELEESIKGKDFWIGQFTEKFATQITNHGGALKQIEVLENDSKKFILDKLQEAQDMNVSYLRDYAQSLPKKAGAEVESTVEQPSRDAQNQTR